VRKGRFAGETNNKPRKDRASFIGIEHNVKVRNKIRTALVLIRKQPKNLNDFYATYLKDKERKSKKNPT
jgi:hypothetical protein